MTLQHRKNMDTFFLSNLSSTHFRTNRCGEYNCMNCKVKWIKETVLKWLKNIFINLALESSAHFLKSRGLIGYLNVTIFNGIFYTNGGSKFSILLTPYQPFLQI